VFTSIFLIFTWIYSYFSFLFLPYLHQKNFFEIRARGGQEEFPPSTAIFLCICLFILHIYSDLFPFPFASFFPYFLQKIYPNPSKKWWGGAISPIMVIFLFIWLFIVHIYLCCFRFFFPFASFSPYFLQKKFSKFEQGGIPPALPRYAPARWCPSPMGLPVARPRLQNLVSVWKTLR